MTVGSLFSGIGGFDLGFQRAGFEIKWMVEQSGFCQNILWKRFPGVPLQPDVRKCGAWNLSEVDVICGGFPCQPTSTIGKRQVEEDERWLWPEFARIIGSLRPRYVVVENPTGILARGFGRILGDLADLGYDAEWEVFPAGAFGARHRRDRAFVVAYPAGGRLEGRDGEAANRRGYQVLRATPPAESVVRWDITAPAVCRAIDGVPDRVDRLRALGNAVVPQVAEYIGGCIFAHSDKKGASGD